MKYLDLFEKLNQNNNSIELSFIVLLSYIFRINDYINRETKINIGDKLLKKMSYDDYISIGLLLDKIDMFNSNRKDNNIAEILNIVKKYKNEFLYEIEKISEQNEFKLAEEFLRKMKKEIQNLRESKEKNNQYELSKIHKPKFKAINLKSGPFKKDTKNMQLKKDEFDRKHTKHKRKDFYEEKENIIKKIEKKLDLLPDNDADSDEILNNIKSYLEKKVNEIS